MSAGTGGTSVTIGRYIVCKGIAKRLFVPDPEHSVSYAGLWEAAGLLPQLLLGKADLDFYLFGRLRTMCGLPD